MFEELPVKITPQALEAIKDIKANKGIPADYGLRIGVKGGRGCGGAQFLLGFDHLKEDDAVYQLAGIDIYISKKHFLYLLDVQIDYEETEEGVGFTFTKQQTS
jgi:iron-sulfur cluster assembly protein